MEKLNNIKVYAVLVAYNPHNDELDLAVSIVEEVNAELKL